MIHLEYFGHGITFYTGQALTLSTASLVSDTQDSSPPRELVTNSPCLPLRPPPTAQKLGPDYQIVTELNPSEWL